MRPLLTALYATAFLTVSSAGTLQASPPPVTRAVNAAAPSKTEVPSVLEQADRHSLAARRLFLTYNPRLSPDRAAYYGKCVSDSARDMKVDPSIIAAMIVKESTAREDARSKYAHGLMQIYWKLWEPVLTKKWGIRTVGQLIEPRNNIMAGTWIFKGCLERSKGDVAGALKRYLGSNGKHYVARIMDYRKRYISFLQESGA